MSLYWNFKTSSDTSLLVEFNKKVDIQTSRQVQALVRWLHREPIAGVTEWTFGYATVLIEYNPAVITESGLRHLLTVALEEIGRDIGGGEVETKSKDVASEMSRKDGEAQTQNKAVGAETHDETHHKTHDKTHHKTHHKTRDKSSRCLVIPVCYGIQSKDFGPDLETVAHVNGLTPEEVVHLHTDRDYYVYFTGFLPSFPFLGGMSPSIVTPRLKQPRTKVAAGSVGIAGEQTGIYPVESPGGWQLIGRTPVSLFDLRRTQPFVLEAGDWLRFESIDKAEFERLALENKQAPISDFLYYNRGDL